MDQQIEQTPIRSFFTNKYNRPQNQDNLPSSAGLQLSPRCQEKIGLFISFFALAASFEVLLTSSIGKSVFPNDAAVSDFLTKPLSKSHQHFTNGTVLGTIGFVVSLIVLAYCVNRLWNLKKMPHPKWSSTTFIDSGLFEFDGNPLHKVQDFYNASRIDHQSHTLAAFIIHQNKCIYVGIPHESYEANVTCSDFFDKEMERLKSKGTLPKECQYDRFVKVPIRLCINLKERQSVNLNTK